MLAIFLAAIIIPVRYSFYGGYNNNLYCFANIRILHFCKISISYNAQDPFAKVKILGFTTKIDTTDLAKEEAADPKIKEDKKKEKPTKNGTGAYIFKNLFQKDIILHVLRFLKDMVGILKPKVFIIKGKVGLYEPHHTAWLHTIVSILSELNIFTKLDIETVWSDEHFEGEVIVKGHLAAVALLFRLLKFLITKNTLKVIKVIIRARKKQKVLKLAT